MIFFCETECIYKSDGEDNKRKVKELKAQLTALRQQVREWADRLLDIAEYQYKTHGIIGVAEEMGKAGGDA